MITLKHIDVLSAAKMAAVIDAILGFIIALVIFVFAGVFSSVFGASSMILLGVGAALLVIMPILLFIVGFVVTAIEIWLYNVLADRFGGIKVDLIKNQLKKIDPLSASRIYAIGGAMIGFVVGIIAAIVGLLSGSSVFAAFGLLSIVLFPVLFAAALFIMVGVGTIIYNFIASRIGGVMLWFKGRELRRVGAFSYARIEGILGALGGLVEGIIYAIKSLVVPTSAAIPIIAQSLGALSIIAYPIFYFVLTFVCAFVEAWLYNAVVPKVGAVRLTLS